MWKVPSRHAVEERHVGEIPARVVDTVAFFILRAALYIAESRSPRSARVPSSTF